MASSGIRRKVDDLGRVVIPAGIRRSLGIREGDPVEVSVEGERVVLAKPRDACVFCGREEEDLTGFRGRLVCRDCLAALGGVEERLRATTEAQVAARADGARGPADLPDWDAPPPRRTAAGSASRTAAVASSPRPAPRPAPGPAPSPPPEPATHEEPHRPEPARAPAVEPVAEPDHAEDPHLPEAPGPEHREPERRESGTDREGPRRRPPYDPASTTAW